MLITKEFTFAAAHKLINHKGKCKNLHGHTYKLQVTIRGKPNSDGMIIDFSDIKNIVKTSVIEKLDHSYLNEIIQQPTAENIILWIWDKLKDKLNLFELKLWETPTSFITYCGDYAK